MLTANKTSTPMKNSKTSANLCEVSQVSKKKEDKDATEQDNKAKETHTTKHFIPKIT